MHTVSMVAKEDQGSQQHLVGRVVGVDLVGHLGGIQQVHLRLGLSQLALKRCRQLLLQLLGRPVRVEQQGAPLVERRHKVVLAHQSHVVDGHHVGMQHAVGGREGHGADAQVGVDHPAVLVRVVLLLQLHVQGRGIGHLAQTIGQGVGRAVGIHVPQLVLRNELGHGAAVVASGQVRFSAGTHREAVAGCGLGQVVKHGLGSRSRHTLALQAATNHQGSRSIEAAVVHRRHHVEVEGAKGAAVGRCSINHGQRLDSGGNGSQEALGRPGTVQAHLEHTHLGAKHAQQTHHVVENLGTVAHHHHHVLGIGCTHILERAVAHPQRVRELAHNTVNNLGHLLLGWGCNGVALLALLPELGHITDLCGNLGQLLGGGVVHRSHLGPGECPIVEVHHGQAGAQGHKVGNDGHVVCLLHTVRAQNGGTSVAHTHNLGVVDTDNQLRAERTCLDVEHGREAVLRDAVEVGVEVAQTLRGGEDRGQLTSGQGTVHGTASTRLDLQAHGLADLSKSILLTIANKTVDLLTQVGRGCRGIHEGNVTKAVTNVGHSRAPANCLGLALKLDGNDLR
eukprot:comp23984_c0_seq1/m.42583 comp23984_c0_seq1/g.42583  ORF comp23984_c0_seq1/g.42583 comp23984_c0_seq1/m.42583 type:complete len:564 (+) comp23984_c0_seq1:1749-3440(+)